MVWLVATVLFLALGIYLLITKKHYVGKTTVRGEVIGITPEANIVTLRYKPARDTEYIEADLFISYKAVDVVFSMLYIGKGVLVTYGDSDPETPLEMTLSSKNRHGTYFEAACRLSFAVAAVCLVMFILSVLGH